MYNKFNMEKDIAYIKFRKYFIYLYININIYYVFIFEKYDFFVKIIYFFGKYKNNNININDYY